MAAAEALKINRGINDNVKAVDDKMEHVDGRVQAVRTNLEDVDNKLQGVNDEVQIRARTRERVFIIRSPGERKRLNISRRG